MEQTVASPRRNRRRDNGDGTIRRRRDGTWEGRTNVLRVDGITARRSFYGHTREEVAAKLRAARFRREESVAEPTRQFVRDFLGEWLETRRSQIRATTWAHYEKYLKNHIIPSLGHHRLNQLQPQHVQRFYQEKVDSGLSPTSVRHFHVILHRALKQAFRWGLVTRNVADLVDPPRRAHVEMQVLNGDQIKALLEVTQGTRLYALWVLAVTTGMRRGELLALRWKDVDLATASLSVVATLQEVRHRQFMLAEPKSQRSRRRIALSSLAVEALRQRRLAQREEQVLAGTAWRENDLVFSNALGDFLDANNVVNRTFRPLLQQAGLPKIRFHDLRHSAATLMLSQGVHPKIASEMLGHATVAITLDLYSHVTETMQRDVASAMDRLLG